jgi:CheY-like chemotaxis protein
MEDVMEYREVTNTEQACETVATRDNVFESETTITEYSQVQTPKEADHQSLRKTIESLPQFDVQMGQQHSLRILIAEDSLVNLKIALWFLRKLGYHPDVAFNGVEVINALRRQSYDVILMDAEMPEMDGREATMVLRKIFPANQQPQIIAMTANSSHGNRESFLSIGMNDYVTKPLDLEEMVRALLVCHPLPGTNLVVPEESNNEERTFSKVA